MKKILILSLATILSVLGIAQNDVTKFLGIPVDGTKSAMIQKLKAKGFTYNSTTEELSGEFNGRDVNISVVTNNNKVYRIVVVDENGLSESEIKNRWNILCRQFISNGKYIPADLTGNYEIPDSEDISYEMIVNDKRYEAVYYQINPNEKDSAGYMKMYLDKINQKYTQDELDAMTEEQLQYVTLEMLFDMLKDLGSHKVVWFTISQRFGMYRIVIYYDNEKNKANGEDL